MFVTTRQLQNLVIPYPKFIGQVLSKSCLAKRKYGASFYHKKNADFSYVNDKWNSVIIMFLVTLSAKTSQESTVFTLNKPGISSSSDAISDPLLFGYLLPLDTIHHIVGGFQERVTTKRLVKRLDNLDNNF